MDFEQRVLEEVRTNPVLFDEAYEVMRIGELSGKGYLYDTNNLRNTIKTPSGNIMTRANAQKLLEVPLEIGNKLQIEALNVLEYFQLLDK